MIYQVPNDDTSSSCSQCKKQQAHLQTHYPQPSVKYQNKNKFSNKNNHVFQNYQKQNHEDYIKILQQQNARLKQLAKIQEKQIIELKYELQINKSENLFNYRSVPSPQVFQIGRQGMRYLSPQLKNNNYMTSQFRLQKALLQKQVKNLQLKLYQTSIKLKQHEDTVNWMQKFILSFNNMAQQLCLQYGSKMTVKGLSLRKKTSLCWKYIKQLINYLAK